MTDNADHKVELKDIFGVLETRIIESFIESEALSYPNNVDDEMPTQYGVKPLDLSPDGEEWVSSVTQSIVNEIAKLDGADRVCFRSHGNAGSLIRELRIDAKGDYFNWKSGNIMVNFCTCGKIDCWGSVRYEVKNTRNIHNDGV